MPDVETTLAEDHRSQILKDLDDFNTAPEFGMMGILQEQLDSNTEEPTTPAPDEDKAEDIKAKELDYEKAYAPLNSSIQELGYRMDTRVADLERQIATAKKQDKQQPAPQLPPNYDPDQPVTMAQFMELQQGMQQSLEKNKNRAREAQMRTEYLRAHLDLERFRQRNPDFVVTPQDLDAAFNRYVANDLGKAKNTNWNGHFSQIHQQTAAPKMQSRIAELEKEIETLKKKGSAPAHPVSPATAKAPAATTRSSIQSPATQGTDSDIINLATFKQRGNFKGFANDLKRMKGIRNNAS